MEPSEPTRSRAPVGPAPAGPPTVVFAGGGTGGHLFPGIAVAHALAERGLSVRCVFIGSTRSVERQIVTGYGFEHVALPVESSSLLWNNPMRFANRMWKSALAARNYFRECRASVVVGLGGYASVPAVWAARTSGIPILLLEQNAVPGRATSLLSRRAELTCLGFEDAARRLPGRCPRLVTGNPVRAEIRDLAAAAPADGARRTLLVLGGSQGSAALNEAVLACVERSPQDFAGWAIVHQTGRRDFDAVRDRYAALKLDVSAAPFFDDLPRHYAQAGLAIARAERSRFQNWPARACRLCWFLSARRSAITSGSTRTLLSTWGPRGSCGNRSTVR